MLEGFIVDYTEGGWLPRWPSIGERGCMPSTLLDAVIADAAVKGIIKGKLLETALEGMLHHANNDSDDKDYGREGASYYCKLGYVPKDLFNNNVNLSLDAAYGDFCIAQVAKVLGRDELIDEYMERSKNYTKLFDKETGFMRGRKLDGSFEEGFDPYDWGGDYTEGSAWQNSFASLQLSGGGSKIIPSVQAHVGLLDATLQNVIHRFTLEGVFPTKIPDLSMQYENAANIVEFPCNFTYQYLYDEDDGNPLDAGHRK